MFEVLCDAEMCSAGGQVVRNNRTNENDFVIVDVGHHKLNLFS